jgi:CubicO group peptidase (beta-lactamase class C family)
VKIRQLLEHTSGIPSFTNFLQEGVRVCPSIKEFILKYCSRDLDVEPGARFRYNNGGYVILGAVVEQLTGLSYEEALRRYIISPLGMISSGLARQGIRLPRAAKGYQRRGGQIVDAGEIDPYLAFSAGGMYSTATDLALWEKIFYADAILSSGSRALLSAAPVDAYFCGQRFDRRSIGSGRTEREIVFHGGRIEGFNSLLLRIPQDRVLIVLLNNTDSTRLETMARGLMDVLYGRSPRAPRRSLAEECRVAQEGEGIGAAIRDLRAIRREEGVLTDPEPEELQLNAFGYELLGRQRLSDALAVFCFAVEQFPSSWNAHDSLAEAQAALEERGGGQELYEILGAEPRKQECLGTNSKTEERHRGPNTWSTPGLTLSR